MHRSEQGVFHCQLQLFLLFLPQLYYTKSSPPYEGGVLRLWSERGGDFLLFTKNQVVEQNHHPEPLLHKEGRKIQNENRSQHN